MWRKSTRESKMTSLIKSPFILFLFNLISLATASRAANANDPQKFSVAGSLTKLKCPDHVNHQIFKQNTNKNEIKNHMNEKCKQGLAGEDTYSMFLTAFSAGNKNAVEALIELGADVFKKSDKVLGLTPYEYMKTSSPLSVEQEAIMKTLDDSKKASKRTFPDHKKDEIALKYWVRHSNSKIVIDFDQKHGKKISSETYDYEFDDGSNLLMQTIIGNNIVLFGDLMRFWTNHKDGATFLNRPWARKDLKGTIDVKAHFNIDPVGWCPLKLAITLNRYEMASTLINHPKFIRYNDVKSYARGLPLAQRIPMLKMFRFTWPESEDKTKVDTCRTYKTYAEAIKNAFDDETCLNKHSYKHGLADDAAVEAAVAHLTPDLMNVVVREWDTTDKSDEAILTVLWNGLKKDVKSSVDGFKSKFNILEAFYQKKLNNSGLFKTTKAPYLDILSEDFTNQKLFRAFVTTYTTSTDNFREYMENDQAAAIISLLTAYSKNEQSMEKISARYNGMHYENLAHLAIFSMTDEDKLIEVMKKLIQINKKFLNETSFAASINSVKYKIVQSHEHVVEYSIPDRMGWTPLMYALALRKNKLAKFLIDNGAITKYKNRSALDAKGIANQRCSAFKNVEARLNRTHFNAPILVMNTVTKNKAFVDSIIESIIKEMADNHAY